MPDTVDLATARRIALAAQGFGRPRPPAVNAGHVARLATRLGLFQIDSVNVIERAHYLPAFSRLGPYDKALIDRAAWGPRRERRLFEYWAHVASLLPCSLHPLLRFRMAEYDDAPPRGPVSAFARARRPDAMALLDRIRSEGPMAASDFGQGRAGPGGWWNWSEAKQALEWLFSAGHLTTATRRASFERVYDLPERVLPPDILALPTPAPADAKRALMEHAARALGIATEFDLRDYFRLDPAGARTGLRELVDAGTLLPVRVDGWDRPAYLHRDAQRPRRISARALLAPFDPLIWERARTERLFGFRYRIGIYTPAAQRTHGYYVLPFLLDEAIVARVDLKADRRTGRLLVQALHLEPGAPPETLDALQAELADIARWLRLSHGDQPAVSAR